MANLPINKIPLFFVEIFIVLSFINCRCAMTQEEEGIPRPTTEDEKEPIYIHSGEFNYCKDFEGKESCCNDYQLKQLKNNFDALEGIFGGDGGCDVCVVNLKRFWCYFTCAPNQEEFLKLGNLTNYTIDGEVKLLRDITFYIKDDTNCQLFQSCKKTKFVAQVPSMGNAIGFTNFQGINAYTKCPVYVTMEIDDQRGLNYSIDNCSIEVPSNGNISGYLNNSACSCNSCEYKCNFEVDTSLPFMNGSNIGLIIGCYIFVFVATIGLFFYKKTVGENDKENVNPNDFNYSKIKE